VSYCLASAAGLAAIWDVAVVGIRLSVRSDLVLLTFELAVLLALALTILVKGAPGGDWHAHVFSPAAAPSGFSGIVVAAVFGVLAFTGFEAPAYLGEEARDPRRTVPRAILLTTAGIGVVFVFFFYVTTVGYGLPNIGKLPADPAPWDTLGRTYWGPGPTVLVDIASVVALVAGALAAQNGAARMVFALGRDGLLPRVLGRTLAQFGTPAVALTFLLAGSVAVGLGFGFGFQPLPAFSLLSLIVTLCALGVYALAQVGLARYFWRLGRFNPLWHGVAPAPGVRRDRLPVHQERVAAADVPVEPGDLDRDRLGRGRDPYRRLAHDVQARPARAGGRDHRRGRHARGGGPARLVGGRTWQIGASSS